MVFDVLITDSNGTYVYQVYKAHGRKGSLLTITLEPNAQHVCLLVWKQWMTGRDWSALAQKGTYYIKGDTLGPDDLTIGGIKQQITRLETPTISFTIK